MLSKTEFLGQFAATAVGQSIFGQPPWGYDRLRELACHHTIIRVMLGHRIYDPYKYKFQTIKKNVSLLPSELIKQISKEAVDLGHEVVEKKKEDPLRVRCDSWVLETHVHFCTDLNLLCGMRLEKSLSLLPATLYRQLSVVGDNGNTTWAC